MNQHNKATTFSNTFGVLGYVSVAFQWVWSLLLLAYPIISSDTTILLPAHASEAPQPLALSPAITPLLTFIALFVTVLVLTLTVITIARLPKAVGTHAKTMNTSVTRVVLPAATRHKKVTKKERQRLTYQIILGFKLLLVCVPLGMLLFVRPISELPGSAVWVIGAFSFACSLFYFTLQQLIARIAKVPQNSVW